MHRSIPNLPERVESVYLVSSSGLTKVGWSRDPGARIYGLTAGSAAPITVLAIEPGDRELERALHAILRSYRVHHELFCDIAADEWHALLASANDWLVNSGPAPNPPASYVARHAIWLDAASQPQLNEANDGSASVISFGTSPADLQLRKTVVWILRSYRLGPNRYMHMTPDEYGHVLKQARLFQDKVAWPVLPASYVARHADWHAAHLTQAISGRRSDP